MIMIRMHAYDVQLRILVLANELRSLQSHMWTWSHVSFIILHVLQSHEFKTRMMDLDHDDRQQRGTCRLLEKPKWIKTHQHACMLLPWSVRNVWWNTCTVRMMRILVWLGACGFALCWLGACSFALRWRGTCAFAFDVLKFTRFMPNPNPNWASTWHRMQMLVLTGSVGSHCNALKALWSIWTFSTSVCWSTAPFTFWIWAFWVCQMDQPCNWAKVFVIISCWICIHAWNFDLWQLCSTIKIRFC